MDQRGIKWKGSGSVSLPQHKLHGNKGDPVTCSFSGDRKVVSTKKEKNMPQESSEWSKDK
jgi:hypothetical protein